MYTSPLPYGKGHGFYDSTNPRPSPHPSILGQLQPQPQPPYSPTTPRQPTPTNTGSAPPSLYHQTAKGSSSLPTPLPRPQMNGSYSDSYTSTIPIPQRYTSSPLPPLPLPPKHPSSPPLPPTFPSTLPFSPSSLPSSLPTFSHPPPPSLSPPLSSLARAPTFSHPPPPPLPLPRTSYPPPDRAPPPPPEYTYSSAHPPPIPEKRPPLPPLPPAPPTQGLRNHAPVEVELDDDAALALAIERSLSDVGGRRMRPRVDVNAVGGPSSGERKGSREESFRREESSRTMGREGTREGTLSPTEEWGIGSPAQSLSLHRETSLPLQRETSRHSQTPATTFSNEKAAGGGWKGLKVVNPEPDWEEEEEGEEGTIMPESTGGGTGEGSRQGSRDDGAGGSGAPEMSRQSSGASLEISLPASEFIRFSYHPTPKDPLSPFSHPPTSHLPSTILLPPLPTTLQILAPSLPLLLRDLISRANTLLEPCPSSFATAASDDPKFVVSCWVRFLRLPIPPGGGGGGRREREERIEGGVGRTVLGLMLEEVGDHAPEPSTSGAGSIPRSTPLPFAVTPESGLNPLLPPYSTSLFVPLELRIPLPVTLGALVERLHAAVERGKVVYSRGGSSSSLDLTREDKAVWGLWRGMLDHPGPKGEGSSKKKHQNGVLKGASLAEQPSAVGAGEEGEDLGLTGKPEKQGKRFMLRKVTSRVMGAMQGGGKVGMDEREEWITPFTDTDRGV